MTEMLQKTENVAKNVANENSQDLTEQWKKGELPSGWYWVELKEGTFVDGKKSIILDYLFEFTNDFERHPYLVEQVLAPVPSYEEWKAAQEQLHKEGIWYTEISHKKVLKENAQLKELLKECKTPLEVYNEMFGNKEELLTKIDEALK